MFRNFRNLSASALCCSVALAGFAPEAGAKGFQVLHSFTGAPDGAFPYSVLVKDREGNFYGTTYEGGSAAQGIIFRLAPDGTEAVLHSFSGSDGSNPEGNLVIDKSGNVYGTTLGGGSEDFGAIFRLAPDGTETVLHSFTDGRDSAAPMGGLIIDRKGNLYGTTSGVGDLGSVFRFSARGHFATLHNFQGSSDGASPYGALVLDTQANLYGTTWDGGAKGDGTVFRLATDGTLTVLHTFSGGKDGANPAAGMAIDAAGNLYGTTFFGGGTGCDGGGCGTVFEIAANGAETVLYSFKDGHDGSAPAAAPVLDASGNLYGTASSSGTGDGTVFRLVPEGTLTVLHAFGTGSNGSDPYAGLILDHGNLYGTTEYDDQTNGLGVVFRVRR